MEFPDLHSLSHTLNKPDLYSDWLAEHQQELKEKYTSFGESDHLLYHRGESWDSKLFGMNVGKIEHVSGDQSSSAKKVAENFFSQSPYDYCVIRISQARMNWIQAFEQAGAILLDTTVDMVYPITSVETPITMPNVIKNAKEFAPEKITDFASSFHEGRFFSDPFVQKGQQAYFEWLSNSLKGQAADEVWVYVDQEKLHGIMTLKYDSYGEVKVLKIPLVAKHNDSDLPGVARTLLQAAIVRAHEQHCEALIINTQGNNIPAQRAYLAAGFKPYHTGVTMRWLRAQLN